MSAPYVTGHSRYSVGKDGIGSAAEVRASGNRPFKRLRSVSLFRMHYPPEQSLRDLARPGVVHEYDKAVGYGIGHRLRPGAR